ncbi:MAG: hypothetical protein WAL80_20980 [Xanthobacteraceae bacterium]|jgi:hypothetical protein
MRSLVAALVAAAISVTLANAQDAGKTAAPAAAQPGAPEPYQPGLGEIMALQQMRHIKLWYAGAGNNWPLADYEIGELNEGFDDVKNLLGADIVAQHVGGPLDALQKAIDGKNRAAFLASFDKLSAGCNACHHALDHGFIVIARPNLLPYSNQIFGPQK